MTSYAKRRKKEPDKSVNSIVLTVVACLAMFTSGNKIYDSLLDGLKLVLGAVYLDTQNTGRQEIQIFQGELTQS